MRERNNARLKMKYSRDISKKVLAISKTKPFQLSVKIFLNINPIARTKNPRYRVPILAYLIARIFVLVIGFPNWL